MIFLTTVLARTSPCIILIICLSLLLLSHRASLIRDHHPLMPKKEQMFVLLRQFTAQAGLGLRELIENYHYKQQTLVFGRLFLGIIAEEIFRHN